MLRKDAKSVEIKLQLPDFEWVARWPMIPLMRESLYQEHAIG